MLVRIALPLGVMVALVFGIYYYSAVDQSGSHHASPLPVNTRMGGDLVMLDQHGEPFDTASLRGKTVLMFFGFTQCPDICPATLAHLVQVYRGLEEEGVAASVVPVFVTIDPARDTPEQLLDYLAWFHPDLVGLTGSMAQVAEMARLYGAVFVAPDEADDDYAIAHSDYVYLIDDQGRVRNLYPADTAVEVMVRDVLSLIR